MNRYLQKTTSAAPLATFRIAFGLLLFISIIRFWMNGWIEALYIEPKYFFSFYGFEFIEPLGKYSYLLFAICALAALLVALGLYYKAASIMLFLSFTYIELIDKSTYLNHYYFISMVSLLMIILPAHVYYSIDTLRNKKLASQFIPQWCIDSIKLFVCIIYVYAGLAKVNTDWLLHAQPLRIWLPARNDMPLIGNLFNYTWVAYFFSWAGCLYDLTIPFLLMNRSTRLYAFMAVVTFHILTALLFPIGMFPYIMIVTVLIFFPAEFHQNILHRIGGWLRLSESFIFPANTYKYPLRTTAVFTTMLVIFFVIQIVLPFRHLLYPGELFWTEQGYRFSWRVMLMEKAGYAQFTVTDDLGKKVTVDNKDFLTPLQEKMMATQPDMILQFAHILSDHYSKEGFVNPQVYVDAYVTVNGRLGKTLIDPTVDLAKEKESFNHKKWILPFYDEIKGL